MAKLTHEECLNRLLSAACHNSSEIDDYNEYTIEVHCAKFIIVAKPSDEPDHCDENGNDVWAYKILSIERSKE